MGFYFMNEIFKDIPNYEGIYQVSNLGNVRSLERKVKHHKGGFKLVKERILSLETTNKGYLRASLSKNNITKRYGVHQLVAMAFLSHTTCGYKMVVNHKNFIRNDNRVNNLEIISQRENSNRKHIKSNSKYVGVYKSWNKWRSDIRIGNKTIYIGNYNTQEEARDAYQKRLKDYLLTNK